MIAPLTAPVIGINMDFQPASGCEPSVCWAPTDYASAVIAAGGVPVLLTPTVCDAVRARQLDLVDGVVLVGGRDLDPRNDGYLLHPACCLQATLREMSDRDLMRRMEYRRLPVLGIGAGMQLVNVVCGGTLSLHLPEDYPEAVSHLAPGDRGHRHALDVEPGSLVGRVYQDGKAYAVSRHHQAVDDVAPGFAATARCPDGIVEAIEWAGDDWLAVGVQWHPEGEDATAVDRMIFGEWMKGIG